MCVCEKQLDSDFPTALLKDSEQEMHLSINRTAMHAMGSIVRQYCNAHKEADKYTQREEEKVKGYFCSLHTIFVLFCSFDLFFLWMVLFS